MILLLLLCGDGVPGEVAARAEALVRRELEGVAGEVTLSLHRTEAEMAAAVRKAEPAAPEGFAAFYSYRARTIFAWMAPRPDEHLFRDGLPGILAGALVHEAQHARGALTDPKYALQPAWRIEGMADLAASRVSPAWNWLLESRAFRASAAGLFAPWEKFDSMGTDGLDAAQRATWHAQAWLRAQSRREAPRPPWILHDGTGEPVGGGFRLVAPAGGEALAVARDADALDARVCVESGGVEMVFGFPDRIGSIRFEDGRVRLAGERGHPAPPLRPGVRLSLRRGAVRVGDEIVLHVRPRPGRVGWRSVDGSLLVLP